jgi:Uma2 family endonuclease
VPDVVAFAQSPAKREPYPTTPVSVAIEILSPGDYFTTVVRKCERYVEWGVPDVLLFDPASRRTWCFDTVTGGMIPVQGTYTFKSKPVDLILANVWQEVDELL